MTRLVSAMIAIGVGLSVLGVGEGDASAQVSGPGIFGELQGGMCVPELSTYAANMSYYAGNGGLTDVTASSWVQCPIINATGLLPSPIEAYIWIMNTGTGTSSCQLHRVDPTTGIIQASTSITTPTSMTSEGQFVFGTPSLTGGFYSMECLLQPGATVLGYYVNLAN